MVYSQPIRKSSELAKFLTVRTGMVSSCVSWDDIAAGSPKFRNWSRLKIERVLRKTNGFAARGGVSQKSVVAWENGKVNLKVTASLSTKADETILYFDFDTHKRGKRADVRKLYFRLKAKIPELGPLYQNDRGGGAWLRISTRTSDSPHCPEEFVFDPKLGKRRAVGSPRGRAWNAMVKRIHEWARSELVASGLDVEAVEVHGRVLVAEDFVPVDGSCPGLMKPPPSMKFVGNEVVKWADLAARDFTPTVVVKNQTVACGSNRYRAVLDGRAIAGVIGLANSLDRLMPDRPTRTVSGRKISDHQFAEIAAILVHVEVQKDGSNPHVVHKNQIVALRERKVLNYAWTFEAYKAIRDYFSAKGWVDWEDNTYMPGIRNEKGEMLTRGQAMKWQVGQELREVVVRFVVSAIGKINTTHTNQ